VLSGDDEARAQAEKETRRWAEEAERAEALEAEKRVWRSGEAGKRKEGGGKEGRGGFWMGGTGHMEEEGTRGR